MGARGPKPVSAKQLAARGSWRAKERAREERARAETTEELPQTRIRAPSCPKWLPTRAKAEWRRVVPALVKLQVATGLDESLLVAYCAAYADLVDATETLVAEGSTYKGPTGIIKKHPATGLRDQAHRRLLQAIGQLGLSPVARERLGIVPVEPNTNAPEKNPKERFFH